MKLLLKGETRKIKIKWGNQRKRGRQLCARGWDRFELAVKKKKKKQKN